MASLNRVEAIGNLGADAETRYLPSGKPVSSFRIACNERWTDRETKEKKERTEWIPCVLFGQEKVLQYLTKGKQVFLEGKFVLPKSGKIKRASLAGLPESTSTASNCLDPAMVLPVSPMLRFPVSMIPIHTALRCRMTTSRSRKEILV